MDLSLSLALPSVDETVRETILDDQNSYSFLYPLSDSEPESEYGSDNEDYHSLPSFETDSLFVDSFLDSVPMDLDDGDEQGFGSGSIPDLEEWISEELNNSSDYDPMDSDLIDSDRLLIAGFQFESDLVELDSSNSNSAIEMTDEMYDCLQFDHPTQIESPNQDQDWEAILNDTNNQSDLEEMVRHLEWEVLLAVDNLYGSADPFSENEVTFFRQLLQIDPKTGPPASKSVVESLPDVSVSKNDRELECAVCKDEFLVGETVKRLPCLHDYHANCIVQWLGIRNTCPLCRFELATDD